MKANKKLIQMLRQDARANLTKLASALNIPKSTLFDRLKKLRGGLIKRNTCIVDFKQLGYNSRYIFLLKTSPDSREDAAKYLAECPHINNLHITNSEFDFLFEAVFKNNKEMSDFNDNLAKGIKIKRIVKYEVIKDIFREKFMAGQVD